MTLRYVQRKQNPQSIFEGEEINVYFQVPKRNVQKLKEGGFYNWKGKQKIK